MKSRRRSIVAATAVLACGLGGPALLTQIASAQGTSAPSGSAEGTSSQDASGQPASAHSTSTQAASTQDAPDSQRGRAVFDYWCAPCHAPGPGHPGTQSLQIKYDGRLPAVLEERVDLTPEAIKVFVRQGVLSMTPFRKTEITDAELDDLAAYLAE